MKGLMLTALFLFYLQPSFGQRDNVSLLVQSADGKTVKLVWFLKSWSSDITGFDIKRKEGLQDWVKLNSEPVLPEISVKKKLSIVEADKAEESRVRAKLYKMIAAKKIQPLDNATFLQKLNSDERAVQELSNNLSRDYDLALIDGFAFVDYSITKKTNYEYGVFIQSTNILLDSVLWNYGQIPDLNTVTEITSKATTTKKGIQIIWNADLDKMKSGNVAGFNVYREGIRLNSSPIISTTDDPSEFTFYDRSANSAIPNQYSISAESLFGIEGIIKSYTYNPDDHPSEYKSTEVTEIAALGYYFKDGIRVDWRFPKEHERFIKGFYVEKANMPAKYSTVSPLLPSETSTFVDKTPSPVSGYIRYRIIALYNDKTTVPGIERVYIYFPVREPPTPQDLKTKVLSEEKKTTVYFSWASPMNGDSTTEYYKIYDYDTSKNLYSPITDKLIKATKFTYTISHGVATTHKFYVSSIGKNQTESQPSDTVYIAIPSYDLPTPAISNLFADGNKAVARWDYPGIRDLKGFRLYQNKVEIANETTINKNSREYATPELEGGASYDFTIRAVSEGGILSDLSAPVTVAISKGRAK